MRWERKSFPIQGLTEQGWISKLIEAELKNQAPVLWPDQPSVAKNLQKNEGNHVCLFPNLLSQDLRVRYD